MPKQTKKITTTKGSDSEDPKKEKPEKSSRPVLTRVAPRDDQTSEEEITLGELKDIQLPELLPILPLRGVVVYPQTAVPLDHWPAAFDPPGG